MKCAVGEKRENNFWATPKVVAKSDKTVESVYTNDAEVVQTKSRTFFGGGISTRREWGDGKWSMTRQFSDYAPDGKRLEYMITESVDCGTITNSVSSYDLLGRLIAKKVPGVNGSEILTVNSYDGASSRLLSSSTTGSPSVTTIITNAENISALHRTERRFETIQHTKRLIGKSTEFPLVLE